MLLRVSLVWRRKPRRLAGRLVIEILGVRLVVKRPHPSSGRLFALLLIRFASCAPCFLFRIGEASLKILVHLTVGSHTRQLVRQTSESGIVPHVQWQFLG